jgi:hypothetical protein
MYKPWPKCATCSRPMILRRRTASLDDIVEAKPHSFVCENCPAQTLRTPFPPAQ